MRHHLRNFQGLRPKDAPRNKDLTYADACYDVKLWDGQLRNFPCPAVACTPGVEVLTIMDVSGCSCLNWQTIVNEVYDCNLIFYTGDGAPKFTTAAGICTGVEHAWNIPAPAAPTVAAVHCDTPDVRYVAYMVTQLVMVDGYLLESPVSPPTGWYAIAQAGSATVTGLTPAHPAAVGFNIYRAESGFHAGGEDATPTVAGWFLAGTTAGTSFVDDLARFAPPASPLLLERGNPPADLYSLGRTDSGIFVGLSGAHLWFTLPGEPMTWHPTRRRSIHPTWGAPVALKVHGDDVYVLTDDLPVYYRTRLAESGPVFDRNVIQKHLPLVAINSLSSGVNGVVYASVDTLVQLNGGKAMSLSSPWFNHDDWRRIKPTTIAGTIHNDAYIFASETDAFLLEFGDSTFAENKRSQLVGLRLGGTIKQATAFKAGKTVKWAQGGKVYEWDRLAAGPQAHSEQPPYENPCCPGFYRTGLVDANVSGTFTAGEVHTLPNTTVDLEVWRETTQAGERQVLRSLRVTNRKPFRLPAVKREEDTFVELTFCGTVTSLSVATSLTSLRGTGS